MAEEQKGFVGEEGGAGASSPALDLIASAFLVLLSIVVMVASALLPVPDMIYTAPGLLPFLTGASLLAMSLALGWDAWRRRQAGAGGGPADDIGDPFRTGLLVAIIVAYLAALQFISFEYAFRLFGFRFVVSAFEPVSIIVLTAILSIFWRGPLWACVAISTAWIFALASIFRYVFIIPMPG